jgi:hypothetical protein
MSRKLKLNVFRSNPLRATFSPFIRRKPLIEERCSGAINLGQAFDLDIGLAPDLDLGLVCDLDLVLPSQPPLWRCSLGGVLHSEEMLPSQVRPSDLRMAIPGPPHSG